MYTINQVKRKIMLFRCTVRAVPYVFLFALLSLPTCAVAADKILKVGISPFTPFVIPAESKHKGFSVDLWKTIAQQLDVEYEFVWNQGVMEKLQNLIDGRTDIAIGGITITEERETKVDFCHPHFHTGLDIMTLSATKESLFTLISSFFTRTKFLVIAGLFLLIIIAGHVIWFVERRTPKDEKAFHQDYIPGVFEGMYWAVVTASTVGYGDKVPRRWAGRVLTAALIIVALPLFGFFIAELSSDLTLRSMKSSIHGPEDLWGHRVGVVRGTTSSEFMSTRPTNLSNFEKIDDAYQALLNGEIDAVVYDAPNLMYFALGTAKGKVRVVGKIFAPQDYGIAVQQGSIWREKINRTLLDLIESGDYQRIRTEWFGEGK
jgi:ABC-type amino acid transport substrate-binding protein